LTEPQHILHKSWQLKSTESQVKQVTSEVLKAIEDENFGDDAIFGVHLSLEEAFINAIKHGNHGDPEKSIAVECLITPEKIDISITDEGFGFDPAGVPDPRCNNNLYKSSGRGVLLIQSYMDVVEYNSRGNCIHMIKYRNTETPHEAKTQCSS